VKRVGLFRVGLLIGCVCIAMICLLSGCRRPPPPLNFEQDVYRMPRRLYGASDRVMARMVRDFNRGRVVKIITIGSDYLVALPSAALFADQSPRLLWSGRGKLNQIVMFLRQFRKVAINVTCYGSKYVSDKREHALSLARASVVANYLWAQGVDSRFIFSQGVGREKPITNYLGNDRSPSSRIEITFRDAIV